MLVPLFFVCDHFSLPAQLQSKNPRTQNRARARCAVPCSMVASLPTIGLSCRDAAFSKCSRPRLAVEPEFRQGRLVGTGSRWRQTGVRTLVIL
jgi:hypothetical protein